MKCIASDKVVGDTVASNEIGISPIGEVTIDVAELLRVATDDSPRMKIKIALPELIPINKVMIRRYDFAGVVGTFVDGQPKTQEVAFESSLDSGGIRYNFPKTMFQHTVNHLSIKSIESTITKLIASSRASTAAIKQFKELIRFMETGGEAITDLKAFFRNMDLPRRTCACTSTSSRAYSTCASDSK